MDDQQYLTERLEDQLQWYDRKSQYNQKWFKRLRLTEILSAALIPCLSGYSDNVIHFEWIVAALGVVIAVSAAASSLFKFHENWIQYRTTAEQLRHEKYLYLTGTKPYSSEDDKFKSLVTRVESLISKENSYWSEVVKNEKGVKA